MHTNNSTNYIYTLDFPKIYYTPSSNFKMYRVLVFIKAHTYTQNFANNANKSLVGI